MTTKKNIEHRRDTVLAIARRLLDGGLPYVTVRDIERETGLGVRTISRDVSALAAAGRVTLNKRKTYHPVTVRDNLFGGCTMGQHFINTIIAISVEGA